MERRSPDTPVDDRTILKTEIQPPKDAAAAKRTLPGNTNHNPNATPDAQTSGSNSPRKQP